jgi:2-oxoglutarate ferredoxin oxidoreductase subunit alpha
LITRLVEKIRRNKDDIIQLEENDLEDAEVVVCSYGISARTALWPVELARREGIKVGTLRLITVWPFPEERIRQLAREVKAFIVPELNYGQIALEVERCAAGQAEVILVPHAGGDIHKPEKVLEAIRRAAR